jgi:predicted PurR-regulated permease PerM
MSVHRVSQTPLWILAIIASAIALSLGSRFFVPLTLGLFLAAVLHPMVALLRRLHIPHVLGATIAVLGALAVLALVVVLLDAPIRAMRAEIPKTLMTVRGRLASLGIPLPGAAPAQTKASTRADTNAKIRDSTSGSRHPPSAPAVSPTTDTAAASPRAGGGGSPTSGIGQTIARAFGVTAAALFALVEILLLAFFILAAGDGWREKLRKASHRERGEGVLDAVVEIRRMVLRYLFVNVVINAAQGALIAAVVWPLGYPSPVLWGVLTFIAEFIPYFGGTGMVALLFLTGLTDGRGFAHAFIAPIAYLVITTLQNNLVSPKAYGTSLRLNPTAILAGVMFWGLIWGVAGLFLAVPLLAAMRIVAERSERLTPVAVFLGE